MYCGPQTGMLKFFCHMRKNNIARTCLALLLCSFAGCSSGYRRELPKDLSVKVSDNVSILDQERFAQGGRLLVIPFKAGPNVEANPGLGRIALFVAKGIMETFAKNPSALTVIDPQEALSADMVMKGYVVGIEDRASRKRLPFLDKKVVLAIEGQVTDQENGKNILRFSKEKIGITAKVSMESLAYDMGREIAESIIAKTK